MVKMRMELDWEKIEEEGIISPEEVKESFQKDFLARGIYKDEHGFYVGGSFFGFGGWIASMLEEELFISYLTEWKWYNSDRSEREDEFIVEDLLAYARNGGSWEGLPNGVYLERSSC